MKRAGGWPATSSSAKPYVWFGRADPSLHDDEVATLRSRLARELHGILNYMAQCDLEKPNEPVVVLFTRVSPEATRAFLLAPACHAVAGAGGASFSACVSVRASASFASGPSSPTLSTSAASPTLSASAPTLSALYHAGSMTAGAGGGAGGGDAELTVPERARLKLLRRVVDEARDRMNPRLVLLVCVQRPWAWTLLFLRSHHRLQPALHRLCPAAAQLVVERRLVAVPALVAIHDLTPGPEVVPKLRPRVANALRPLLQWMGEEGELEAPDERIPVLYIASDPRFVAERFVCLAAPVEGGEARGGPAEGGLDVEEEEDDDDFGLGALSPAAARPGEGHERSGGGGVWGEGGGARGGAGAAAGAAAAAALVAAGGSLARLGDMELQRVLLARDRLFEVVEVLRPRLLVLVSWLRPAQLVLVLCRDYSRLLVGLAEALPDVPVHVWAPRRLPQPSLDAQVFDYCYCSSCPRRGLPQEGVRCCPKCLVTRYCSNECQAAHWEAGHCRACEPLRQAKLSSVAARGAGPGVRSSIARLASLTAAQG